MERNYTGRDSDIPLNEQRIVITGGTGLVGTYLVAELLRQGYQDVTLLVREEKSVNKLNRFLYKHQLSALAERLSICCVSLFDLKALTKELSGCDILYHCAAIVSFDDKESQALIEENVLMTSMVAEAAHLASVVRLVYVSSVSVLTAKPYPLMTSEDSGMVTLEGKNPYAVSKFFAENEVWRIAEKGLDVMVVNPAVIIGEGDWTGKSIAAIFRHMHKCSLFYTRGIVGYVSSHDVARMMIELSQKKYVGGKRYVLCAENISYKQFLDMVSVSVGSSKPTIQVPAFLISFAEKVTIAFSRLFGYEPIPRYVFSNLTDKQLYDGRQVTGITGLDYTPLKEDITQIGRSYLTDIKR